MSRNVPTSLPSRNETSGSISSPAVRVLAFLALRDVTDEIKTGDGLANQLIYGDEGATLAKELSDVAAALDTLTNDIMSDDSLVHALIYDPSKATMLDDLDGSLYYSYHQRHYSS